MPNPQEPEKETWSYTATPTEHLEELRVACTYSYVWGLKTGLWAGTLLGAIIVGLVVIIIHHFL